MVYKRWWPRISLRSKQAKMIHAQCRVALFLNLPNTVFSYTLIWIHKVSDRRAQRQCWLIGVSTTILRSYMKSCGFWSSWPSTIWIRRIWDRRVQKESLSKLRRSSDSRRMSLETVISVLNHVHGSYGFRRAQYAFSYLLYHACKSYRKLLPGEKTEHCCRPEK